MSIATRAELIKRLQEGNPDEILVYTYWSDNDFQYHEDKSQARELIEASLKYSAISEANNYLQMEYKGNFISTCKTCNEQFQTKELHDDWELWYCPKHEKGE